MSLPTSPTSTEKAPSSRPVESPLRGELFAAEQMARHATYLASAHEVVAARGSNGLLERLDANEDTLRAYLRSTRKLAAPLSITPAGECLLDSFYLIEEQIQMARRHLPRGYSRELPRLATGPSKGLPRVYDLVLEYISHQDAQVEAESLTSFLAAYQAVAPLKLGELWAVPIMLRLALIENLQGIATRIVAARDERRSADLWVERMQQMNEIDPSRIVVIVAEMAKADILLSTSFVAQFCQRIARQPSALQLARDWLAHKVAAQGQTVERLVHQENRAQAANQVAASNSIASLRFLGAMEWRDFVEELSLVERMLRTDPPGIYVAMDFATRDIYRHAVEALARYGDKPEEDVARVAIQFAEAGARERGVHDRSAHVGFYLIDHGKALLDQALKPRWPWHALLEKAILGSPLRFYLGGIVLLTLLATFAFVLIAQTAGVHGWRLATLSVAFALAASQTAVAVMNWMSMFIVGPRLLPRMDFKAGIPPDCSTIVAVPTMLTSIAGIDRLIETMEIHYLSNSDKHLRFALLTDFGDAPEAVLPEDAALLQHARTGVATLQRRHSTGGNDIFHLFHRPRRWNPSEGVWMGHERKRGKLEDFNALLRGCPSDAFSSIAGNTDILAGTRYVITLDTDTQLPRDAARKLVGTMAHPLNRPEIDPVRGVVTKGYGILQPRIGVSLPTARKSPFARLFAGDSGIDPYSRAVSDVYQDIFAEGTFVGKGIYDVDAFATTLGGRFPENTILSHDLLESCHARSALVGDVELFEAFPSRYSVDAERRHRWIRGDWQIAQWLLPRVPNGGVEWIASPLSALSKWKLFDNLRRSLVPPAVAALLLGTWLFFPSFGWISLLSVLVLLLLPAAISMLGEIVRGSTEIPLALQAKSVLQSLVRRTAQALLALALLLHEAAMNLDAVARSLYRLLVTRRRLLEWKTSCDVERGARIGLAECCAAMWISPSVAAAMAIFLAILHPAELGSALPILAAWILAPWIAWRISRSTPSAPAVLSPDQTEFLRCTALRTWRFFDIFVNARENWLPPDNYQEEPLSAVAPRTSPTNIGLSLLANMAAHDLGHVSAGRLIQRTSDTFATLRRLEKHRGHLYNWYDTRSLRPLAPLYVSTVDSGNLAGMLLTLGAGLREQIDASIVPPQIFAGIRDTVAVVRGAAGSAPALAEIEAALAGPNLPLAASRAALEKLHELAVGFSAALAADADAEAKAWAESLAALCKDHLDDLLHVAPWAAILSPQASSAAEAGPAPTLREVSALSGLGSSHVREGAANARARIALLESLAEECEALARMEWAFLFDTSRKLFSIGYSVAANRLDAGHYDLLASEARLGSYVAIAQGEVGQEHWFSLSRLLVASRGEPIMVSWSGSMFEYLMPQLIMPGYDNALIGQTCIAAVRRQIEHGKLHGVPWGVSESGYNLTDAHFAYQYRAFGVPGIGLKRGLAGDLVIAPYATMMALMVAPEEACKNLQRLSREGRSGAYGFYEAVDYTPSRMPPNRTSVTIRSFMAHHQGMGLLALVHLLCGMPMQRRFGSCPMLKATELLLQERIPRAQANVLSPEMEIGESPARSTEGAAARNFSSPHSTTPEMHLLSNGRYHVAISSAGGGFSRWNGLDVTRWREDATRDCWGYFIFLRDVDSGKFWSATHQPTLHATRRYEAIFALGRAEFRQRHLGLDVHTEIGVAPEDDVEIRRVTISNRSRVARTIELTSYAEVVMCTAAADAAHPAFSNLFVQTEFERESSAIFCTRRARSHDEKPPCMVHLVVGQGGKQGPVSCETDRARFVGRGGTLAHPAAVGGPSELSNTTGSVLDPVVALRRKVSLAPGEEATVVFVLGMAEGRASAGRIAGKYQNLRMAERAFELAWTHNQVALRQLNATESEAQLYDHLAGAVLYACPARRADPEILRRNRRGQNSLWAYGISGDTPIILVRIGEVARIEVVRQLVRAHSYWQAKGLVVELVIVNEDVSTYRQALQDAILDAIALGSGTQMVDKPFGIFVKLSEQIADENLVLLQSVARIVFDAERGSFAEQVRGHGAQAASGVPCLDLPSRVRRSRVGNTEDNEPEPRDLVFRNGLGGFTPDGREYVTTLHPGRTTPMPWINVLANPSFGTIVSESGGSCTWVENAHEFRLTPWNNDSVQDTSGEAFYIRDDQTGEYWSPTPLPARGATPYVIRHGFGYTVFEHKENGIFSELWIFVAMDAPVKFAVLKLRNVSGRSRRLSATAYFEWVLGELRGKCAMHVQTEMDPESGALLARNPYSTEFPERIAFVDVNASDRSMTGDRGEFIGRNGTLAKPEGLRRKYLSGKVGPGLDPCGAVMVPVELRDGEEHETTFRLGVGRDPADVQTLIERFRRAGASRKALEGVWEHWNRTLGTVVVETPDPAVNVMANGWLLYQTLACRMWGRSGFYQSGGAYGFRDQLQDSMALVHAEPALVREHLLRAASRQFQRGDVQHWWHPPSGRGVRTHFSDDYLWLPFAACHYVSSTADTGVLDEPVAFIDGRPVKAEEDAYYDLPMHSGESASLYVHCVRAIENGMQVGVHGLPLIGCGDWNDGMNRVGHEGRGESVWLAFFFYTVLRKFAELADSRHDTVFAGRCLAHAASLQQSIERNAWDGDWYRRAYFDNGDPLGSSMNEECQIDSLPQSWSVISGAGSPERSRAAMQSVDARLVRRDAKLVQLFDPPFDRCASDPGYIKGYIPGVRENGGQYTHAAIWAAMAFALMGDHERAWEIFNLLNPVNHGSSPAGISAYKVEPYVVAADVYALPPHTGRGGWTWYTGSASWMYRLLVETLLGIQLEGTHMRVAPRLPNAWASTVVHYRYRRARYRISIENGVGDPTKPWKLTLDGAVLPDDRIPLADDEREHFVRAEVAAEPGQP